MSFLKQFSLFLILISIISFADYFFTGTGAIGIDDGNIFLNYAQHIAHGQGFVFNTNGERVEGFTSLLWVLVCAFFYLFTSHPEFLLIVFCLLLTSFTVTVIFRTLKRDIQKTYPVFTKYFFWIYCAFIISIGASYTAWSVLSLMENALWNFIFTLLIILVISTIEPIRVSLSRQIIIVLLGCLLSLTRPEALVWNLVFTTVLLWSFYQNNRRIYFPVIYFVCVAGVTAGLTIFRLRYFGFQFPNTYYAKVSPDRIYNFIEGSKYAMSFLTGYQPVISFLFVLMTVVLLYNLPKIKWFRRNYSDALTDGFVVKKFCVVTAIILIGFALPCTTGGDHFGGFRFYQDLLLLFAFGFVGVAWMMKKYSNNQQQIKFISLSTIILFFLVIAFNDLIDLKNPAKTQLNFEFFLAREGRAMAEKLNAAFPSKPSVGMIAVGGFGLEYNGNTIDVMGLNNIAMGHSPGDRKGIKNHAAFNKDIFFQLKPDVLLPANASGFKEAKVEYFNLLDVNNFDNQAMKNIFNDAEFEKIYLPVFIMDKKNNSGFFSFVNADVINSLESNANLLVQQLN